MKKGDFVEALYGNLRGLWLEVVEVRYRHRAHGDLVLCETGNGLRYWLRAANVRLVGNMR